ncbi:MAG TPA: hypothetical protein VIK01_12600, partial [Polyangiaceae bacterium]
MSARTRAGAALVRALLTLLALWALSCQSGLSTDLSGRQCASGLCATGYTCDVASNICVPLGSDACSKGQTTCNGECVTLATDAENCNGCGFQCTAPEHGQAVCAGHCGVVCDDGYTSCGARCIDTKTDVDNCGACGQKCSDLGGGTLTCVDSTCGITCDAPLTSCSG